MVEEAAILFKLILASLLDISWVFEHIGMLFVGVHLQSYSIIPTLLGSDFGDLGHLWRQNNIIVSCWGCHPIQTASCIHIRHVQRVWAHWYAVHRFKVAAFLSYTHPTPLRTLVIWVISGVKMMSLRHGWTFHPIQTASSIHIRHVQSVWAHWYAVHRHKVAALLSKTNPTWLRFWWSGSLM